MRKTSSEQVRIQFLEAGIESGFALVDEAKSYRAQGQPSFSSRVLGEASEIAADIERRLQQLAKSEAEPFFPLVVELRDEIAAAERGMF
jgi:hypothetical protein